MPTLKKLTVLAIILAAICAFSATNAPAATFTASETGEIAGKALTTQEFNLGGGNVIKCTSASPTGKIVKTASPEIHLTVGYGGCTGTIFGIPAGTIEINPATWNITVTGTAHLLNTITIKVPALNCHFTMAPQSVNLLNFTNNLGRLKLLFQLAQIVYTSAQGCGSGKATMTGTVEIERVGGGTISFDP